MNGDGDALRDHPTVEHLVVAVAVKVHDHAPEGRRLFPAYEQGTTPIASISFQPATALVSSVTRTATTGSDVH